MIRKNKLKITTDRLTNLTRTFLEIVDIQHGIYPEDSLDDFEEVDVPSAHKIITPGQRRQFGLKKGILLSPSLGQNKEHLSSLPDQGSKLKTIDVSLSKLRSSISR